MSLFKLSDHVVGTYTQFVCSSCLCPSPLVQESDVVPLKIPSYITCASVIANKYSSPCSVLPVYIIKCMCCVCV